MKFSGSYIRVPEVMERRDNMIPTKIVVVTVNAIPPFSTKSG